MNHDYEELQKRLLASLISYPETIPPVYELFHGRKVFGFKYQPIYDIVVNLWLSREHIDSVVVLQKVSTKEQKDIVCDIGPLASAFGNETYARLLLEQATKKALGEVCSEIVYLAKKPEQDALELLDLAETKVFKIAQGVSRKNIVSSAVASDLAYERIERVSQYGPEGLPTGLPSLDRLLGGLQKQELIILAGRPSAGKTALGLDISIHVASCGYPVAIFTAEMSAVQLSIRAISHQSGIDSHKMISGTLNSQELEIVKEYANKTGRLPIFYEDSGGISISELRAKARRFKLEHSISLIVVDYLQLISAAKRDTREQEVAQVSRTLKAVAKELAVPVLCLSQLSRLIEQRGDKKPMLSDLRESGAIEQDADVVVFVNAAANEIDTRDIIIAKQRNGPLGEFAVYFDKKTSRFEEIEYGNPRQNSI